MRKKGNGWAIAGALGALGYIAWKARKEKNERINQQSSLAQKNEPVRMASVNEEEIKKLYHELALKYHPDSAQSDRDKEFRSGLFKKIKNAYDCRDIETLRLYKLD